MGTAITVFKFLIGGAGVLLYFYRNALFSKFAREGTRNADAVHTVFVNNHGSFSYITAGQSEHLHVLAIASTVLVGLMIVIDLIQRRSGNRKLPSVRP